MTEKFKDIEIRYLYIKRFNWQSAIEREEFLGHPLRSYVYRAIFNPQTQHHKLLIPGMDGGIGLDTLTAANEIADFELIPLSLDNILDFEIKETDLDNLNKWFESENSDIEKLYSEREPEGLKKLKQALHHHDQGEAEALARATDVIMDLWDVNPDKFYVLLDMINFITEADLDSHLDPASYIRYHPVDGKGLNIAQALRALDKYNGDNRRTSEEIGDLFMAVEACVTECTRKIVNDLTD